MKKKEREKKKEKGGRGNEGGKGGGGKKEGGEEDQVKGMENIFNEIIEESILNLKKEIPIKLQEAHKMPNKLTQKETTHDR